MEFLQINVVILLVVGQVYSTTTKYFTYEEDAPGTEIGNLSRDLQIDPAEDPETAFRFMQESDTYLIRMREIDGLLTVGETIDREQLCQQSPKCLITFDVVTFSKEKYQLIHVEIEVKDINDNSPRFLANETVLDISENAPLDSRFNLDEAVDEDVGNNYIQSYSISHNSHFSIEIRTSEDGVKYPELVLVKKLDREIEDSYTIEVTASDGGSPPRSGSIRLLIKVLDFNDNSPTFEHNSLKVELLEDSPVGFRILKVHAFDPDAGINGEVVYGFVEGPSAEVSRIFKIDPLSGSVTLREMVDFEQKRSYELNIKASDLGPNSMPSTCRVTVEILDVNDNAPEINIKPMTSSSDGVAFITEAAAKESFVALISTSDRDSGSNGYVRCSLHGHEHFKLQQAYGDNLMIVTTRILDRENIAEYNLTVEAEDFGSPPFKTIRQYTIRVTDENDNAPLFNKSLYEITVLENNIPGSFIATIAATDPDTGKNAKLSYKLIDRHFLDGDPVSTYVSIDQLSGSLYSLRSFDFETLKQIDLTIQARDSGTPQLSSMTTVRIRISDQNDNNPYFTYPDFQNDSIEVPVPSDAPAGYILIRVKANDEDYGENSKLSFGIVEGDQDLFLIDRRAGHVVLKQKLDLPCDDFLDIKVRVTDGGKPPRFSTSSIRFIITDAEAFTDQYIISVGDEREDLNFNMYSTVTIVVGGVCTLVLVVVVTLSVFCKLQNKARSYGSKPTKNPCLFGTTTLSVYNATDPSIYGSQTRYLSHGKPSTRVQACLYEEKCPELSSKVFLTPRPFERSALWQDDKYGLQRSGPGNTDQLSVKDSGKGDSDFNDSDSDASADGQKRTLSTFQPWTKSSFHSTNTLNVDWQSSYCVIPTHSLHATPGNAYTIGFSQAPAYSNTHVNPRSWKESGNNTNIPKARGSVAQTLCRAGTLPAYSAQYREQRTARAQDQNQAHHDILAVTALSEIATTF